MLDHTPPPAIPSGPSGSRRSCASSSGPDYRQRLPAGLRPRGDAEPSWPASIRPTISIRSPSSRPPAAGMSRPIPGSIPARTWPRGSPPARRSKPSACVLAGPTGAPWPGAAAGTSRPASRARWASASTATSPSPPPMRASASAWSRILIVDFDVHHGNGTQEIFYADGTGRLLLDPPLPVLSRHRRADETGTGKGWASRATSPSAMAPGGPTTSPPSGPGLETMADKVRPELVLISAGFDAHAEDPVGDLGLETEDFEELTRVVVDVADDARRAGGSSASSREATTSPSWPAASRPTCGPSGQEPGRLARETASRGA